MRIDVFQDTVCPWCRIGKAHLQQALDQWDSTAEVVYRPFFLDPTIPPEGRDFEAHMLAKGGGRMTLEDFFERPRQMGAAVGLTFNFEAIQRAPNTLLSHQLIELTPAERQEALIDDLYAAYFEHGQDIGALDVLVDIATGHDWAADDIRQRLTAGEGREAVLAQVQKARQLGITGVPFFVLGGTFGLSGAQPPQVILQALEQAALFQA